MTLKLTVLQERYAIAQLEAGTEVPEWAERGEFHSATRTDREVSIICPEQNVPEGVKAEKGWRILKIQGQLEFSLIGIIAEIAGRLAGAGISIFVTSTYDTDYILVKEEKLEKAVETLQNAEFGVEQLGE